MTSEPASVGVRAVGVVLVGAGGHARVVVEAMNARGRPLVGHVAADGHGSDSTIDGISVGRWLGTDDAIADLIVAGHSFALGLGFVDRAGAERRARILTALTDADLLTVVHDRSTVSPSASLGRGVFVAGAAFVGTSTRLGDGVIVNSGAVVDHESRLETNVHIASGATLSGSVSIGPDSLIGAGATVRQGVRIGSGVVVGAGAVVVADVADGVTVVGVPARAVAR